MKTWLIILFLSCLFAERPSASDRLAPEKTEVIQEKLSTMWMVVALNMIGTDVLSGFIPGKQEEIIDFAGGKENVQYAMLAGMIIYEIPISMIFLSRYMPRNTSRWVNVTAAALSAISIVGAGGLEPHYLFAATAEILTLSYITWVALKWPVPERIGQSPHSLDLTLNAGGSGLRYAYKF
ncbi:MAG: DUF6326 family protein [Fibrobacteria bacterium]